MLYRTNKQLSTLATGFCSDNMEVLYTAEAQATGGREGHVKSSDGILDLNLHKPPEMGGQGGTTNPEQLFAAAWGPCYLGALGTVARKSGADVSGASANVKISFNKDGEGYSLSAEIEVHIPDINIQQAQQLAELAHRICPYSKATRGNVPSKIVAI